MDFTYFILHKVVKRQLRCGGMFSNHYKFCTKCASEKISTIGQYLTKMWTKQCGLLFGPPCICYHLIISRCRL